MIGQNLLKRYVKSFKKYVCLFKTTGKFRGNVSSEIVSYQRKDGVPLVSYLRFSLFIFISFHDVHDIESLGNGDTSLFTDSSMIKTHPYLIIRNHVDVFLLRSDTQQSSHT